MSLLKLLMDGKVEEFNAKRGQRTVLEMFAADLSELPLKGVDFSSANLEKADLSGTDLRKSNLSKTNLVGADLTGARLQSCVAIKARLREACLTDVDASDAEFGGADLGEAEMSGIKAAGARFGNARLKNISAEKADFSGCDFSEARLSEAQLQDAVLSKAKFAQADLSKADLSRANLSEADLSGARLSGAKLCGADLSKASLVGADLTGADLTDARLQGANLSKADLFEVIGRPILAVEPPPTAPTRSFEEFHVDEASIAVSGSAVAAIWEEETDTDTSLIGVYFTDKPVFFEVPVAADSLLARCLLPAAENSFFIAALLDNPGGVMLQVLRLSPGPTISSLTTTRLGYMPVVRPMFVADKDSFYLYGIGRQGALSVHRCSPSEPEVLKEQLRAPAGTYRGFCGIQDPILLGKGGTVAVVGPTGIGKLLSIPAGFPGRLSMAVVGEAEQVAILWAAKEEKGFRFQLVGTGASEMIRGEIKVEIGALELVYFQKRFLLAWTRESDGGTPVGCWVDSKGQSGKPFPLTPKKADITEIRALVEGDRLFLGLTTFQEGMIAIELCGDNLEQPRLLGQI